MFLIFIFCPKFSKLQLPFCLLCLLSATSFVLLKSFPGLSQRPTVTLLTTTCIVGHWGSQYFDVCWLGRDGRFLSRVMQLRPNRFMWGGLQKSSIPSMDALPQVSHRSGETEEPRADVSFYLRSQNLEETASSHSIVNVLMSWCLDVWTIRQSVQTRFVANEIEDLSTGSM